MNVFCRSSITLALNLLAGICLYGQSSSLTADQIVRMSKAGLPDDVIVARIKAAPNPLQLSDDDLIAIKTSGVSDVVIRALVGSTPESGPGTTNATQAESNPDDPMAPHDPGVYLLTVSRQGGMKLAPMERSGSGREKTAGIWTHAITIGVVKAKIKAELPGQRAAVRSTESKPVFYMYFKPGGSFDSGETSSPNQFSLLSFEVKKDHRETTVEKVGFANASAGTDEKKVFKFISEKVKPNMYRVIPDGSLPAGEYAFVTATGMGGTASAAAVEVFDFGVDLK